MSSCFTCEFYKVERYNEKDLCEYDYQTQNGMAKHIPKHKGKLCNDYKEKKET